MGHRSHAFARKCPLLLLTGYPSSASVSAPLDIFHDEDAMIDLFSRREFLQASVAGVAGLAGRNVLGANERIRVGIIGCGGQGTHHLKWLLKNPAVEIVAVCDIYAPRLENAKTLSGAPAFTDYRKLLDQHDIDAVWIATPDHWHAKMALDAMDAGKDIYCEKPLARYWHEAREVYRAALRTGRVIQVGSQECSRESWWKARDLIREGKIGKLIWSQTSYTRNVRDGDWNYYEIDRNAGPHNLDWNAFLGPAPKRPFDPERFFRWRKYWDYSGGIATDLFVHSLHALVIALGNEFPTRGVAGGGLYVHKDRETPDTFLSIIDYPSEHSILVVGSQANEQGLPIVIRGHHATLYMGSQVVLRPERIVGGDEVKIECREIANAIPVHHENFLDCLRRGDSNTNCSVELGYKVNVAVDLMIESYRQNKVMRFDPIRQELLG